MPASSVIEFDRWTRASSDQFAAWTGERVLAGGHATLGDLPRPGVKGVPELADEHDAIVLVESDDADGEIGHVDEPIDPGRSVGPDHLVVPHGDPVVLVCDAT